MKKHLMVLLILISSVKMASSEDLDSIRKFAFELMKSDEYYRAITEFYRINSYFPNNVYYIDNLLQIANCYYISEHYIESINTHMDVLKINKNSYNSIFQISKTYQMINYFYECNDHLENYYDKVSTTFKDTLNILYAINYINLFQFSKASYFLNSISEKSHEYNNAMLFKLILNNDTPLKYKKIYLGIIYNTIIPGAGYFYTNRFQTGLSALFVNLLFGYSTYSCFKNHNSSLGIPLGFLSISFYLGSIYGSIQSIQDYNKILKINFCKQFKF